jgi:hypothetical protein
MILLLAIVAPESDEGGWEKAGLREDVAKLIEFDFIISSLENMKPTRIKPAKSIEHQVREECGQACANPSCREWSTASHEIHHIDGNRANSVKANLLLLCGTCHNKEKAGVISEGDVRLWKRMAEAGALPPPKGQNPAIAFTMGDNYGTVKIEGGSKGRREIPPGLVETELISPALTFNAHYLQCNNEAILSYCCRVSVRNNENIAAEKVAVLLQNIDPIPSAKRRVADNHECYHKPTLPLPTIFPIEVRPVIGDGKTIPPDSTIEFNLFKLVRHGSIPTIRFLGKSDQDEYSMFTPETIEGGTIFMFKPYKITMSVQSLNCAVFIRTFRIIFEAGDNGKIATFTIVNDSTK